MTQTQQFTQWLNDNGYRYEQTGEEIKLNGLWLSEWEELIFDHDARIANLSGNIFTINDKSGEYRLTHYDGSDPEDLGIGANGLIERLTAPTSPVSSVPEQWPRSD